MEVPEDGLMLLVDKPYQWTSFDVVNKLRYILKTKKIGHAGTLDPLATGLLIICAGKQTKKIESYMGLEKEYTGTFVLGQSTPSHDAETEVNQVNSIDHLTETDILQACGPFKGIIQQIPPAHSAIKVKGKRAYHMAREGKAVILEPRQVEIKHFEITAIRFPEIAFKVICSKGTYIRSLARDFGAHLKVGAYLSSLCRTRIGPYHLDEASQINEIVLKTE